MEANRIELMRRTAGIRPAEIAERLGVTERTVYRWERGESPIPDEAKLALAKLFECSVAFLMAWPDDELDAELRP